MTRPCRTLRVAAERVKAVALIAPVHPTAPSGLGHADTVYAGYAPMP